MCGICGKLYVDPQRPADAALLERMMATLGHRGPDARGKYLQGPVGLGHTRLSIIDLTTGAQPMANEDDTVWIVFNGEIYNFQELREGLLARGHRFKSKCDTEVIIHLYEEYGPGCASKLRGMFAYALWDSNRRRLVVTRDRVGIKPLYYCQTKEAFHFASEIKALLADPSVPREVRLPAIRSFLCFNYLPGDDTLLEGIYKLLPGHSLVVEQGKVTVSRYWDLQFTRERAQCSFEEAAGELHEVLRATVDDHMMSDVPVGVLLSGGVDSTAILSFAVHATPKKLKTFTVGFDGGQVVDERPYARLAAERFGTEHYEITITAQDFWNFLPAYVWHMEEPVHEPPAVALYYVSKLAREHVTVVLSGEGGDEGFAGYKNYPMMLRLERLRHALGPFARSSGIIAEAAGVLLGDARVSRYGAALGRPLAAHYFSRTSGPSAFFNRRAAQFCTPAFLQQTESISPARYVSSLLNEVSGQGMLNQMLYVDTKTWLPDDLLIKADKMTMANSLELRVPLLDHKVLEFAASLPAEFKVKGMETKRVLKAALAKRVPKEILDRKKAGFPVPCGMWLRGALNGQVRDVVLSDQAMSRGYFQKDQVTRLFDANANGSDYSREIFCLLTLELWHRSELLRRPEPTPS